ncbi:MAG: sensor histidine kinase, partial [Parvibaculaceae bacterium]
MSAAPATSTPAATLGEFAQAKIRCWMNFALITLALIAYRRDPSLSLTTVWYTFLFTALSAVTLLVWARAISRRPPHSLARVAQRVASIVLDNLAISWILYFGGETLAGVFSVYLWISIGYGMRFGLHYLFANLAAAVLGFATVATLSPFWREYSFLSIGLGVGLVVITLYTAYLITQLHAAVRRAESASRAKGDFLAKMSHELRTPLHGIIAIADLLGGTQSPQQKQEMLRQISVSSNTLLDLINRILDISKYESGIFALQSEPMNLHCVVDDAVSILASQARAKGLELSMFFDAAVENRLIGSPRQVQEILINLAGNALKFTERGSVRISVLSNGEDAGRSSVRIVLRDTGPGIPREYLQRIFDPFTQADDSITRTHGGSGLGTTIARDLVQLMSGEIAIDSEVGVGTTVTVDLTFPHAPEQALPSVAGLRIGLVGDPPRALEDALVTLGLRDVVHAPDFVPRSADCLFVALGARRLLNELDDTAPPAIGVGPMPA